MGIAGNSLKVNHLFASFLRLQSSLTFSIPEAWQLGKPSSEGLRSLTHYTYLSLKKCEFHLKSEWNISTSSEHLPDLGLLSEKNMKIIISLPSDMSHLLVLPTEEKYWQTILKKVAHNTWLNFILLGNRTRKSELNCDLKCFWKPNSGLYWEDLGVRWQSRTHAPLSTRWLPMWYD